MDIIGELIFEFLLESLFGITICNENIKTWTKTIIFLLLSALMPVLMVVGGISAIGRGNVDGGVAILVVAALLEAIFVGGAVYNHNRGWQ